MEADSVLVVLGEISSNLEAIAEDVSCLVTIGIILVILKFLS